MNLTHEKLPPDTAERRPPAVSASGLRKFGVVVSLILLAFLLGGVVLANVYESIRPATRLVYRLQSDEVTASEMVAPLEHRLRAWSGNGLVTKAVDDQHIELLVGTRDAEQIQALKTQLKGAGILRFLIVANSSKHAHLLQLATDEINRSSSSITANESTIEPTTLKTPDRDVLDEARNVVGRWVTVDHVSEAIGATKPLRVALTERLVRDAVTGRVFELPVELMEQNNELKVAQWMEQMKFAAIDVLVVVNRSLDVDGTDLDFAAVTDDHNGGPAIAMSFTDEGSGKFFYLTTENSPQGSLQNRLGIILDERLLSAPNILQPIHSEARITGNFTTAEAQLIVNVLKSGQLPAKLSDAPTSESETELRMGLFATLRAAIRTVTH